MISETTIEEIDVLKDEEYEQLLNFILGSNRDIDEFLRTVEDVEKRDILLDALREDVHNQLTTT